MTFNFNQTAPWTVRNSLLVMWLLLVPFLFVFLNFIFKTKTTGDINILRGFIYNIQYLTNILGDIRCFLTLPVESLLGIYLSVFTL